MTPDEWDRIKEQVNDAMLVHTRPFATALARGTDTGVSLEGSGSYVGMEGRRLLLTCAHVAVLGPLDYRFHGSDEVYGYRGPWTMEPHPVDIAFAPVGNGAWTAHPHGAAAIPYERFAAKHQICEQAELLFFRGFARENAVYGFGVHEANATGYCSQEKMDSGDASIFEMFWDPKETRFTAATSAEARAAIRFDNPHGFSGSLAWNTRYLETLAAGRTWSPEKAVVTGLVRRWDTATKTLLVHRIEHVRAWLDRQVVT